MIENSFEMHIGFFIFYILFVNYVIFMGQILIFGSDPKDNYTKRVV